MQDLIERSRLTYVGWVVFSLGVVMVILDLIAFLLALGEVRLPIFNWIDNIEAVEPFWIGFYLVLIGFSVFYLGLSINQKTDLNRKTDSSDQCRSSDDA